LRKYKYAGGDQGLMYIYFYNPIATKFVNYLPEFLAPNVITLVGFMFSSLPFFVLFSNFGTNLENDQERPITKWFFFLAAFCYFMYRMFDELDGKQARKTGSSSPLGLLFDHGCDAFSIGF
jgi:ethanolaminephosphotransferase